MGDEAVQIALTSCVLDALAIGVIVTDGHARRLYTNAAADRLLNHPKSALRCCRAGKVLATRHETQVSLHTLIARACAQSGSVERSVVEHPSTAAQGGSGKYSTSAGSNYILVSALDQASPDLAVCVLPISSGAGASRPATAAQASNAMMLVRPLERTCNLEIEAQRLLGLTKAEARLASGVAAGLSLQEAACAQDVTLATARSHLKSIFRKTNLKRQSQLVALLRSAQMPIETT